ncbi:MAG: hypothetical protein ABFD96_06115 [Armatimonadia bacterium]
MPRRNRRKSIVTPPRRDKLSPSKRAPMPDDGPTDFTLQRAAERIGLGTACDVESRKVDIVGGPQNRARAEFASSSTLALLYEQGKITHEQYRAGTEYARLHRLLWGRSTPKQSGLAKVMATALPERIEQATRAAKEELDDDAYLDWIQEQRTLYERGEYRLRHIAGETITSRRLIRITLRAVALDGSQPNHPRQVWRLRIALAALAEVWGIE